MQEELSKIGLLDTENQMRTLADVLKEKDYTLVLFYRGDW
jgi:hypothetical protein